MIAELYEPLDIECLVKSAVELWVGDADLSERQIQVLDRARRDLEDHDEGRPTRPAVTALVALADLDTVWVARRSDSHTDAEITLWADEDSAYRYLADHVRGCWDNVRDLDDVPQTAPTDDRAAVECYYSAGRPDETGTVYSDAIGRHEPVSRDVENDGDDDGNDPRSTDAGLEDA